MIVSICLLYLAVTTFAQPYEPTFLYDEITPPNQPWGIDLLAPIGDQDDDGFDDILMTVWEGVGDHYHLRILYGAEEPPYRMLDFAHINVDTSEETYWWSQNRHSGCGDYNGDSYIDIMVELRIDSPQQHSQIYLWFGGPELFDTIWDWRSGSFEDYFIHGAIGDYDGDSRSDFIRRLHSSNYTGYDFHSGDADHISTTPTWSYGIEESFGFANSTEGFGDINGDSYADFTFQHVIFDSAGLEADTIYHLFWMGGPEADSLPDITVVVPANEALSGVWRILGDVNGDGYDDIMASNMSNPELPYPEISLGSESLDFDFSYAHVDPPDWYFPFDKPVDLGDINDDGYGDTGFRNTSYPGGG